MSDATVPPPRSTSTSPAAGDGNQSDSSNGELYFETTLVESADGNLKEEGGEGKPDNKQKRKRTSPKDQAILEAEYAQNPKPNKAARALIVEKVDMNEKEVQIWFQNRRQINRRKSRPLLPHEIVAFGLGGMAALSSDPAPERIFSSAQTVRDQTIKSEQGNASCNLEQHITSSQEAGDIPVPQKLDERVEISREDTAQIIEGSQSSLPSSIPTSITQSSGVSNTQTSSFSISGSVLKSFSSTPGYLSNRWNTVNNSNLTPTTSQTAPLVTPPISHPVLPFSCPERINAPQNSTPSSSISLSMSLDGKAQLISNKLSPLREQAVRPSSSGATLPQKRMLNGLQRSQSAYSPTNAPFVPRLTSGRSRDARTWEFCCDPEARDELTTQAENESNGSAVAAISLMRSSSKTTLKTNNNKRNASTKQDSNMHGKKPKLGRAMSSLARLQNTANSKPGKGNDHLMSSPSGDSDKENWMPGENEGNTRRRPLPAARAEKQYSSKSVLGDNFNIPTHAVNLGGSKNKRRKGGYVEPKVFEDLDNRENVGEEVEKFMRGEISPSKKGDLDCVQGLLSLSQGNWR